MENRQNPTPSYIDKKRFAWLFSVAGPAVSLVGTVAVSGFDVSSWILFFPLVFFYFFVPLLDFLIGEDTSNPPESSIETLEADAYYRWITYATIPVLWVAVIFNCIFLCTYNLTALEWLATVISTGSVLGFGLNVSHELGHKLQTLPRKIALFNTALGAYGHFSIEHNRGHHRHVSTPEDPASSKMGENIYQFACREMPGAALRAWRLEADRLLRQNKSVWHFENEILQALCLTALVYGSLISLYGFDMVIVLIPVAIWGAFQLTSANYVEHYGIQRLKTAHGNYENCLPHHSWNSNHLVSNLVLFQLQRHSDHHAHPGRSYQSLRDFPELPRLPSGYFGMFFLAYLPPLWFRVMDPLLIKTLQGDTSRINFLPSAKNRLIEKFGLVAPN
ncbi:MAG: alkane 1-monooxygenase [Limnohabitans sp.]|nr:alkane 1-monooxygenase [Limnohabitans sp.]